MDAMERSNLVLAKVLDLAMQKGIQEWQLAFKDLGLSAEHEGHFYPCVHWLEAEGLIRVGNYARTMGGAANGAIFNIVLTSRGLAVLGQEVSVEGKNEVLSDTVRKVSEGKVDYHRIGDAIGGILGGFIKSISG